jgi:hypothetical protein
MIDLPSIRSTNLPLPQGLSPLDAWIAIKSVLRTKLGEDEYDMWIRHARLMRYAPPKLKYRAALLVMMPRKDRAIIGAMRHTNKIKKLGRKLKFEIAIGIQPSDDHAERWRKENGRDLTYLEPAPSELWGAA